MTEHSYNGWPASRDPKALGLVPLVVNGTAFVGAGVVGGDVHTVLEYFWKNFDRRVERLVNPGCWSYSYRPNRNNPNELSNHSSGTACDGNAPKHPNGIEAHRNFTRDQIDWVHRILNSVDELDEVVHWGGDWHAPLRPDPMHAEIHDHDLEKLARVARRIREGERIGPPMNNVQRLRVEVLALLDKYGPKIPKNRKVARLWVAAIRKVVKGGPQK